MSKIKGQFAPHTIEMLLSPAFRVLSLTGHRILARLEIELARHGGKDNGRLPVTFADFEEYGIERHAIGPGVREVCALGLVENTRPGHSGNGEFRSPNLFRLTYLRAYGKDPTHDWRQIETAEEAERIAREARRLVKTRVTARSKLPQKKHFTSAGKPTDLGGENPPKARGENPPKTPIYQCGKTHHYLDKISSHLHGPAVQGAESRVGQTPIARQRPLPFKTPIKGGKDIERSCAQCGGNGNAEILFQYKTTGRGRAPVWLHRLCRRYWLEASQKQSARKGSN
jgi:hypothetical protein